MSISSLLGRSTQLCGAFALAMVCAFAAACPARAGSNGQQLILNTGSYVYHETVCGTNNYNQSVCHTFDTPSPQEWELGWWWKGTVTIYAYRWDWLFLGDHPCQVPISQLSNWTNC